MLFLVYRSISTLAVPLYGVLFELLVAKGVIATLGHLGYIELSSFAVNIVVALTLGAGTDYGIFLMGRYHEARQAGQGKEDAFYTAYRGVAPIIIGSGLTIAGACYCLTFARLNYFHTMGPAVAAAEEEHEQHDYEDDGDGRHRQPRMMKPNTRHPSRKKSKNPTSQPPRFQ